MLATTLYRSGGGASVPAIALVAHTKVTPAGNSGGTSPAIITTGANLIVLGVAYANSHTVTISDSKGNTYTALNTATTTAQVGLLYYCLNPIVGSGHTFTIGTSSSQQSMCIAAFSGVKTASAFDQQNANTSLVAGTTVQPGSVTPSVANSLVVTMHSAAFIDLGGGVSVDSGFSQTDYVPLVASTSYGTSLAYLVQGAAAAINPTWTDSVSNSFKVATIATFKPGT